MANRARDAAAPQSWFEPFYQWTEGEIGRVPWADQAPHPLLVQWGAEMVLGDVAVVGCGLGDDAEWLTPRSSTVWAFDVSETAIAWARKRFPESQVEYTVDDLLALDACRTHAYDTVVEIYTLQAMPPESRDAMLHALVDLLRPGGRLVIITRWREPEMELGPVPWPLLRSELERLADHGLTLVEEIPSPPGEAMLQVWQALGSAPSPRGERAGDV